MLSRYFAKHNSEIHQIASSWNSDEAQGCVHDYREAGAQSQKRATCVHAFFRP